MNTIDIITRIRDTSIKILKDLSDYDQTVNALTQLSNKIDTDKIDTIEDLEYHLCMMDVLDYLNRQRIMHEHSVKAANHYLNMISANQTIKTVKISNQTPDGRIPDISQ